MEWVYNIPIETQVQEMKRINKYVKGTLEFNVWYSRGEYFTLKYTFSD